MKLRICPFCETADVAMLKSSSKKIHSVKGTFKHGQWYVVCEVCGGRTGVFATVLEAQTSWGVANEVVKQPILEEFLELKFAIRKIEQILRERIFVPPTATYPDSKPGFGHQQ